MQVCIHLGQSEGRASEGQSSLDFLASTPGILSLQINIFELTGPFKIQMPNNKAMLLTYEAFSKAIVLLCLENRR